MILAIIAAFPIEPITRGCIMPLLDHFHPPLSQRRNGIPFIPLGRNDCARPQPPAAARYFADPNVEFNIEIDVRHLKTRIGHRDRELDAAGADTDGADGADYRYRRDRGLQFGSRTRVDRAIELVSPANKDRPGTRDAFVSKCASYLQQGIGLIVVDLVTNRSADLHAELLLRVTGLRRRAQSYGVPRTDRGKLTSNRTYKPGTMGWR